MRTWIRIRNIIYPDPKHLFSIFISEVLRSRNYLCSASAPPLSIISTPATAPAPAIYCHLKLYYSITVVPVGTIQASFKLTAVNNYLRDNFGYRSGLKQFRLLRLRLRNTALVSILPK